ncbi:alpha/beta hydrolase [Microbacterium aureliae]
MTVSLSAVRSADFSADAASDVILLLHGYGSTEHDLTGLAAALELDQRWASLRAPLQMAHGGAAWFEIQTPGDPASEPVVRATDAIWSWVDAEAGPHARVIAIGFSQGGLMASQLLRTRPERVAATVVLGGFVLRGEQPGDAELARTRPPVFWGRGAADRVIAPAAIERTREFLPGHSSLVERVYPGLGHGIDAAEVRDVRAFLEDARVRGAVAP